MVSISVSLVKQSLSLIKPFGLPTMSATVQTDRQTEGDGRAILIRRGIVQQLVPVPGLTHLEATAVQVTLADRPVKILAANLSTPAH